MLTDIQSIIEEFGKSGEYQSFGNGHINDTYVVYDKDAKYILQRINKDIFKNPCEVMENIKSVTAHIRNKLKAAGKDYKRACMSIVETKDGNLFYKTKDGEYYRMYLFVENAISYDHPSSIKQIEKAGRGFGAFAGMLEDFPAEGIYETIKDFHNTPVRYEAFLKSIENNVADRVKNVDRQIQFVKERASFCSVITDEIANGTVPVRITHNDTKFNNIMFDKDTDAAVCVVDLDTVMPGSLLYDFGDAIRSAAHSGAEDEKDITNVVFDEQIFEGFAKGFLSETATFMTDKEKELLHIAPRLITFENGMRFLTDYLSGDTYYKAKYPEHNLVRSNNQFMLVYQMEQKEDIMRKIIEKYI